MIFINFKTYREGTGIKALTLIKILEEVSEVSGIKIIPVVQVMDIKEASIGTTLEVWTQKIDPIEYGAHTGAILPEAVFEDGAKGTFLNHSELRFPSMDTLKFANERALSIGLKTLIFAGNPEDLKVVSSFKPTYVSYEPPELVGSTTTSVTQAKPEVIAQAVAVAKSFGIPLIVGAGIKSKEDVVKSLELGAMGIAVASDIVKAQDPKKELMDLVEGFKS
jgi:triosephosphate isomerase (TIM)